jgi:ADP-ribosyl-[dinitrogen reductase] hydrolase
MALCLAESLVRCQGFNGDDVMQLWLDWLAHGYWSSRPKAFGIGNTILQALWHYKRTGQLTQSLRPRTAGNGALMRLAPIPIFYVQDEAAGIAASIASTRLTHADPEAIRASEIFAFALYRCFEGNSKEAILPNTIQADDSEGIQRVLHKNYQQMSRDEVRSSGYVIDSLEATLWTCYHANSFEEALVLAVNLGEDTDTIGAICGQLAGAYYGVDAVPSRWLEQLHRIEDIKALAERLIK